MEPERSVWGVRVGTCKDGGEEKLIVVGTTALIWCQRIVQNKLTTQRDINAAIFADR